MAIAFCYLGSPFGIEALIVVLLLNLTTAYEVVITNSMFNKLLPGDIRGAMTGVLNSTVALGRVAFQTTTVYLIGEYGIQAPFYLLVVCDAFMLLLSGVSYFKWGDKV